MLGLLHSLMRLLNHWFAAPIDALLPRLGIHVAHPTHPIGEALTLELVVMVLLLLFFFSARLSLSVERPGPIQHTAEAIYKFVDDQAEQIIGHGHEPYLPFVTTVGLFIVVCNVLGVLPGIPTPTSDPVVPLGVALLTFAYYNWMGIRAQGPIGYLKHFLGPIWWIAWLLFPIEIISHLARIMSLTVRLYANMFASDLLVLVFFSLVPIGVPVLFLGVHFIVALIQAYVFMLLALIYLSQAVTHDDEVAV